MKKKINLVLDLDNTIISSLSPHEISKLDMDKNKLKYHTMYKENSKKHYYFKVFERPHLQDFLDYAFDNFNVCVWTAASRPYASFIIENIILIKPNRKLHIFLYDDNCDQSNTLYNNNSPKDLQYLYHFEGFAPCNTIIVDDLKDVYNANSKQTLRAIYFDAKTSQAQKDTFLLGAMKDLEMIKATFNSKECKVRH